jgi:hypothetical protein
MQNAEVCLCGVFPVDIDSLIMYNVLVKNRFLMRRSFIMKLTKKALSLILASMIIVSSVVAVSFTASAADGTLPAKYYSTNGGGKVGIKKTITIDGSASDWSEDMIIAQGASWDVANHFKGGHENCVLDTYALLACWDDSNLYVGWQMTNTTDTWAREGDGPLSDGGRVLDVPLILALSVDPTSVKMSNKNSSGGSIWGQKMGLSFDTHVDRLFYMSGKPGLGEPSMFKAVDDSGNTNYTTGCVGFKNGGIEYKVAETNICKNIFGLNYSEDPKDVYDENANWVDYKTFKGQSGTHNTKYDSFYEMKIPFKTLGIDASYLTANGIGAMLVATRGESALDCIPFDPSAMLDNALGSYGSDASTSHEKDDEDVITVPLANIGKIRDGSAPTPTPTTAPATDPEPTTTQAPEPTTDAPTTAPAPAKEMTYGDVNGDGVVSIKDATAIQKHAAMLEQLPEEYREAADVNADDNINVKDASAIQKHIAGLDGAGNTGTKFTVFA